ncbi:hypothetical protein P8452_43755 [Trifolium repens]|nr:hypothetical protein P8452_43755 [Trifolium repens]
MKISLPLMILKIVKKMNLMMLQFSALKIWNLLLHKIQSSLAALQVQSFRFLFLRLHQILMDSPSILGRLLVFLVILAAMMSISRSLFRKNTSNRRILKLNLYFLKSF